jgi:hypothetical protein
MPDRSRATPNGATRLNQWAKAMVDLATGGSQEPPAPEEPKNSAAVALGRLGGLTAGQSQKTYVPSAFYGCLEGREGQVGALGKCWNFPLSALVNQ